MITVLMQIEGVLANTTSDSLVENTPIPEGMLLYQALKQSMLITMYSEHPEDKVRFWLQRERVDEPLWFHRIVEARLGVDGMITKARAGGHDPTMLVTASPAHAAASYRSGLHVLLCVHPSYGRPEWKPDYEQPKRPWDEMVAEIVNNRVERADAGSQS